MLNPISFVKHAVDLFDQRICRLYDHGDMESLIFEMAMVPAIRAKSRLVVPAQMVDATPACSLLAGVSKPKVFLGR